MAATKVPQKSSTSPLQRESRIHVIADGDDDEEGCGDATTMPLAVRSAAKTSSSISSATTMAANNSQAKNGEKEIPLYPLHKAVFTNEMDDLERLLGESTQQDLNMQDGHGNTPLHLAVMLGNKEAIALLLLKKAQVRMRNNAGWSALHEAASYGHRSSIEALMRRSREEAYEMFVSRKPHLCEVLSNLGDFYLEVKWEFHTWIPLLSRILPSDVCKIYKRGCSLRMDTTLVDFNERGAHANSWERGDISFLYNPIIAPSSSHSLPVTPTPKSLQSHQTTRTANESLASGEKNGVIGAGGGELAVMDNEKRVYQRICYRYPQRKLNEDVDTLMTHDIISVQLSTKPIRFERAMSGWIFKQEKSEEVGGLVSNYYAVEGLNMVTKKRREHLTADDIKRNKAFVQSLASGATHRLTGGGREKSGLNSSSHSRRKSLAPPPTPTLTWEDYVDSFSNSPLSSPAPVLGRPIVEKVHSKEFRAVVAMCEEFALPVQALLDILEIVSPSAKHMGKLREFCTCRLPPGFPVKLEIPIFPTVSAQVTFQRFEWRKDLPPALFQIPKDYKEDPKCFTDL